MWQSLQWKYQFFFNFLGKINFVQKIGGKKLTEANPRELTTVCSKNWEC